MARLLPAIAGNADYYAIRHQEPGRWEPALRAIVNRHGLTAAPFVRFADGENPVFAAGDSLVVKLVPSIWKRIATREVETLSFLNSHPQVPAPRLVAHGIIEDWHYVVTTRIHGVPLHRAWPGVSLEQRGSLATAYGQLLARLHALPAQSLRPGGIIWQDFCRDAFARWTERSDYRRLPPQLQADGPRFLSSFGAELAGIRGVLLHGDLAPENLLVREIGGQWSIAGMIDFGNAMHGAAWFDLTAASILLQPGDRDTVHLLLEGHEPGASSRLHQIRPVLMAGTLIHPMGDLRACLDMVPGAEACPTWEDVAARFWPD
jgi:hygromycin-B 7''-O-kinase